MSTALVFAPHQDDEVLGCGATICQMVAKKWDVHVIHLGMKVTNDEYPPNVVALYRHRATAVADLLGVKIEFLNFRSNRFDETRRELMLAMCAQVLDKQPNVVFLPWKNDIHQDHRAVAEAGRLATRGFDGPPETYFYEVAGSTETDFVADTYVPCGDEMAARKIDAYKVYAEEVRYGSHPRDPSVILSSMRVHGAVVGARYAEAFKLLRRRWDV